MHKLLWLTDPWSTLSHQNDTTVRLMQEAITLGIPTYWSDSHFILNTSSLTTVNAAEVKNFKTFEEPHDRAEFELSLFHHLHYRLDPPVDFNYISLLDSLNLRAQSAKTQIINPVELIKNQSEKLPPTELASLTPRGCVITDASSVAQAIALFSKDKKIVSKPLNQAQSKGVATWPTPHSPKEWNTLCQKITAQFTQPILLQEFLPGIDQGEVRMWFANGEFIAALKKYPKAGDFRVLIDEGSKVEAYELSKTEIAIAKQVGAVLKKQDAKLAAIDFIEGKISDYNITSPGLLVQMEKVHGKNFARMILEKLYC